VAFSITHSFARTWNSTEHRFLAELFSIDKLLSAAYHLFPPVP